MSSSKPTRKRGTPRSKRRFSRRSAPGEVPGAVIVDPKAPPASIGVLAYGPDRFVEAKARRPEDVREFLDAFPVTWINVDGLGDAKTITELGRMFNLHGLELEDVVNVHQRPKVEPYGEHLFIVARQPAIRGGALGTEQVSLFLGKRFVLTFQEHAGDCFEPVRDRIRRGRGRIRETGSDYLAYTLIDAVVDGYFPVLETWGERLEALELEVMSDPTRDTLHQIHRIKRDLMSIRRAVWPAREAINSLIRDPTPLIAEETRIYLRDCYDHVAQLIDVLETDRELGSDLIDAYLSTVSNRMNGVMKVLTIIATIFMPLSFIAGVYGMNFDPERSPWNMPELGWAFGYPLVLGVMGAVALTMVVQFWRWGWFSPDNAPRRRANENGGDGRDNGAA